MTSYESITILLNITKDLFLYEHISSLLNHRYHAVIVHSSIHLSFTKHLYNKLIDFIINLLFSKSAGHIVYIIKQA